MDCEKFDPLLLDELYEELDEVTSAAVKRHVSGCARCGPILDGMRSTRRMAALPMLSVPDGLEDRVLSSATEAQRAAPAVAFGQAFWQSRASRALSWAGSWAMRPQTAMAAVFLLMIGTSAFVIQSRHSDHAAAVSVTEQGEPAGPAAAADDLQSLDSKAAAAAHGANVPAPITAPPVGVAAVAAVPPATAALAASNTGANAATGAVALGNDPQATTLGGFAGPLDGLTAGKGRAPQGDQAFASALPPSTPEAKDKDRDEEAQQRGSGKKTAQANRAKPDALSEIGNAAAPAGAPNQARGRREGDIAEPRSAPSKNSVQSQERQDGFSAGMAAFRGRNFAEATRQFDAAASSGDQNAALWAAKSVKDSSAGCSAALPRFDAVAQKASGSWIGHEAQLEAARCQIASGQLDAARERLTRLASVPSHAAPAQQALNELNQVASRQMAAKRAAGAGGGAGAARPAAPAPARAQSTDKGAAAPARAPATEKALDTSGF